MREKISFTGNITDKAILAEWYERAAIFVLPSRWESFGLVIPEAMHGGAWPVVTDCCDAFPALLDGGRCGDIVPKENVAALAAALEKRMTHYEETLRLGAEVKRFVDENFSWQEIGKTLDKYLEEVCDLNS